MIPVHLLSCSLPFSVTMKTIYAYSCLLFALSFVEMKPLSITGYVGKSVLIKCSDWDAWTGVKYNDKYFCYSPCIEDKHIIIKAESGKTEYKNRIEVNNTAEGFFVTFNNLQEADSKTYYCGAERYGRDLYIEVNLNVKKAPRKLSSSPKKTPKKVTAGPTLSFAVTDDFIVSSNSSDNMTDMPTSHTTLNTMLPTASATGGAGYVPYFTAGVIWKITIVLVVLILA